MTQRVQRIALTGGIATGKSACLARFAELGARTIDADTLARDAVAPGTPGLAAVVERFGPGVLRPDGSLDRPALGALVFNDAEARRDLERIVHPIVYDAIERWFGELEREAEGSGQPMVGIADIPLLYETGQAHQFDATIVAACRPDQQIERLMARDGLGRSEAEKRIAAQLPIDEKRQRADFVIDTSGSLDDTRRGVDDVWRQITAAVD